MRMNFVYTLPVKSLLPDLVEEFTAFIRRYYGYEVKTFRTDNDTSLSKRFITWVKGEGFAVEKSAPYTLEQNGAAEKVRHIIIVKARSIRIRANLPENLWPEVVKAAGYLLNRTPTRILDWKSPIEALQSYQGLSNPIPSITHLRVYGCRAYPLIYKIPKKQKLRPRA
jgi:hypothetical protein